MISVCMAVHNGEKYIRQQIDSILQQLSVDDELVISDDGSSDGTLSVIRSFDDDRVKLVCDDRKKQGLSKVEMTTLNFENALKHAKGDYIFMSDQDDVWLPCKVELTMNALKDSDYVVSDCFIVDKDLNILHDTRFYKGSGLTKNRWKALISPTPYQGSCAAFRRSVLEKALPFPEGIQSHDRWIGYVASFYFDYVILEVPLIYYRRHSDTVSMAAVGESRDTLFNKIRNRMKYMSELVKLSFD